MRQEYGFFCIYEFPNMVAHIPQRISESSQKSAEIIFPPKNALPKKIADAKI